MGRWRQHTKARDQIWGLFGGFLGWEAYDERLEHAEQHIKAAGIDIDIQLRDLPHDHPNTYCITLSNSDEKRTITALSTGGGMIEITEIDGTGGYDGWWVL